MIDRRQFLISALAAGIYTGTAPTTAMAQFWGKRPNRIQAKQSFHQIIGNVMVNATTASMNTAVKPGDKLRTGPKSQAIFVVGQDAFSLGENSELTLDGEILEDENPVIRAFSLLSGRLLTVFGRTGHKVSTPQATIGIRGTGVYLEALADKSYICTCYGKVDIHANADTQQKTTVTSNHHDQPLWVYGDNSKTYQKQSGQGLIQAAPMQNHTDMELVMLEALVGRRVPFLIDDDYYGAPKRDQY